MNEERDELKTLIKNVFSNVLLNDCSKNDSESPKGFKCITIKTEKCVPVEERGRVKQMMRYLSFFWEIILNSELRM